ncbi:MAG: hypothetical protein ACK5MT_05290 [Actinomycetales bacterium]
MNGCDTQRFLVRWRVVSGCLVEARWNRSDVVFGPVVIAAGGWLDLDGCAGPEFHLSNVPGDGSTLADVTVEVQQWIPAP